MAGLNRLVGKVALVTGASEGIGEAIAKLFVEEGDSVVAVARAALFLASSDASSITGHGLAVDGEQLTKL